ncbi:MAG: hypothetical protein J6W40_02050 [Alphaproteobacteria bacterium]|nr:hypothetical protein [Alphaproteobacteria bacterium]
MFIRYPYSDLYALNLDWILQKITEFEQNNADVEALIDSLGTVVNSVNGQSGDVTITDAMIAGAKLGAVYVAPNVPWTNIVSNITTLYNSGIRIVVCGANNRELYVLFMSGSSVNYARYNPLGSASTFVESVNGQSGAVSITDSMINATDINIFDWADPSETISDYTPANLLALYDNGVRVIFTQNSFGDYANMYALYKSGGTVSYVAYEPTSAVAGVLSVNGMSGAVTLTPADIGAVPTTTTVNGNPLSSDVILTAGDVGAVPTTRTVNNKALSTNITLNAGDVGAVPTTRTVNNKALSTNITLNAGDVGAVPTTRTINGQGLAGDVTLEATDIESGIMTPGNTIAQDLTELKTFDEQIILKYLPQIMSTTIVNASDATKNLIQRNIIPGDGMYFIQLATQTTQTNAVSMYYLRRYNNNFYVTPIFEGTSNQCPRINSSGVLTLNGVTPNNNVIKICVQSVYLP